MSDIQEICELSGLSHKQLADWLGINRGMFHLIEKGKRKTPKKALLKIGTMLKHLRQTKQQVMKGRVLITDHEKLAELHQEKMNKHRKVAVSLQRRLEKLQLSIPLMQARKAMFDHIKTSGVPGYTMNYGDELMMEIIRRDSKDPAKLLEELELIQDKIDTHLAYATLHQQRWKEYMSLI